MVSAVELSLRTITTYAARSDGHTRAEVTIAGQQRGRALASQQGTRLEDAYQALIAESTPGPPSYSGLMVSPASLEHPAPIR